MRLVDLRDRREFLILQQKKLTRKLEEFVSENIEEIDKIMNNKPERILDMEEVIISSSNCEDEVSSGANNRQSGILKDETGFIEYFSPKSLSHSYINLHYYVLYKCNLFVEMSNSQIENIFRNLIYSKIKIDVMDLEKIIIINETFKCIREKVMKKIDNVDCIDETGNYIAGKSIQNNDMVSSSNNLSILVNINSGDIRINSTVLLPDNNINQTSINSIFKNDLFAFPNLEMLFNKEFVINLKNINKISEERKLLEITKKISEIVEMSVEDAKYLSTLEYYDTYGYNEIIPRMLCFGNSTYINAEYEATSSRNTNVVDESNSTNVLRSNLIEIIDSLGENKIPILNFLLNIAPGLKIDVKKYKNDKMYYLVQWAEIL